MRLFVYTSVCVLILASHAKSDIVSTFEDVGVPLHSHLNNAGGGANGSFTSAGNTFNNSYSTSFGGIWSGWAISSETDGTTPGYLNQYSAKPGAGAPTVPGGAASNTYAVGFPLSQGADPFHPTDSLVDLVAGTSPTSIDVTNTTYAYFSMKNGDAFTKPFGPNSFLKLDIQGFSALDGGGSLVGTVVFYLADFRGGLKTIVDTWNTVALTSLAGARSLRFGIESSDNDPKFGINTPAYFAVDNLRLTQSSVPEPSSLLLFSAALVVLASVRWKSKMR